MAMINDLEYPAYRWRNLFKAGGVAGIVMLVIMLVQVVVFILWPPPQTVQGFFNLYQQNKLLGLLSMDLLYLLNNALLIVIYLALFAALKKESESAMLVALALGLVGIAAYYASNTAFEMLSLSSQYAAASSNAQLFLLLGAGEAMLATYKGTAFDVYYVLNAITLLMMARVMLRSNIIGRGIARAGLIAGILMIIPSTAGTIGLIFSFASLVPWAIFLILLIPKFFRLAGDILRD